MSVDKLSMTLETRTTNNESKSINVGYMNPELYGSTDSAVVETFKTNALSFARSLNSLTNNTLMKVTLKSEEDISTAGE